MLDDEHLEDFDQRHVRARNGHRLLEIIAQLTAASLDDDVEVAHILLHFANHFVVFFLRSLAVPRQGIMLDGVDVLAAISASGERVADPESTLLQNVRILEYNHIRAVLTAIVINSLAEDFPV